MEDASLLLTEVTPLLGPCISILPHFLKDFVAEKSPFSLHYHVLCLFSLAYKMLWYCSPSLGRGNLQSQNTHARDVFWNITYTYQQESHQVEVPSLDPIPWLDHPSVFTAKLRGCDWIRSLLLVPSRLSSTYLNLALIFIMPLTGLLCGHRPTHAA